VLNGQRYWRIPVMEGEFLVQESFGIQKAIGGGNLLILAEHAAAALAAAEAAVGAMRVPGVILPFPGGVVRAGSKVGAKKYKNMIASTNDAYCPTLRGRDGVVTQLPNRSTRYWRSSSMVSTVQRSNARCAPASPPPASPASSRSQRATTVGSWGSIISICTRSYSRRVRL
jgi:hypothetical protein